MQPSTDNRQNLPLIIFILFELMLVIFLVTTIIGLNRTDSIDLNNYSELPATSISGLTEQIPSMSSDERELVERALSGLVQLNSDQNSISKSDLRATFRADSIKDQHFSDQNLHFFSAILDLSELGQSYQLYYAYSDQGDNDAIFNAEPFQILCLEGANNCRDIFDPNSRYQIIYNYLRYFTFSNFSISMDSQDPTQINLTLANDSAGPETRNTYISEVKQAVQALGVSPDLFNYYIFGPEDLTYRLDR